MLDIFRSLSQFWTATVSADSGFDDYQIGSDAMLRKVMHQPEKASECSKLEAMSLLAICKIFNSQLIDGILNVLDFGCGVGRHFAILPRWFKESYTGCDIDRESISFCSETHGESNSHRFVWLSSKSIPYPDLHFDISYAFSVFTHMTEEDEVTWLKELARVTRGFCVVSVHGLTFLAQCETWKNDEPGLSEVLTLGRHCVDGINESVTASIGTEVYKDVAHTPDYILREWNKHVEVMAVIPGGFGGIHDAVVFRRR
jgi:SAM-dependent methyltransferase